MFMCVKEALQWFKEQGYPTLLATPLRMLPLKELGGGENR